MHPETPPSKNSEAVAALTATASEAENPIDQNKDLDSADNVANPPPEGKDDNVNVPPGKNRRGHPPGSKNKRDTPSDKATSQPSETPPSPSPKSEIVSINDLEADPLNADIYTAASKLAQRALSESMKTYGVLTPLLGYRLADGKIRIQSGHRRAAAAKEAGLTQVPIQLIDPPGKRGGQELLVHANIQRDKTNEERIREFLALRKGASERARARQKAAGRK